MKHKIKVGDTVYGHWGWAKVMAVFSNTVVQLAYYNIDGTLSHSTTETVIAEKRTAYRID